MVAEQGVSDHDQWMTVYRRHYRKAHNDLLRPIDGISGLLERLADAGARIGVVSSKKTDYIDLGLNRLGLRPWIDVIVGADDTQRHKPDPEPLLYAAGRLGAKPSRCVYVGDAVTDVVAGRAAGMATIAVTWGAATVHDLAAAGPTAVISSVAELAAQLLIDAP
jgi:pyrophosphatase PpaX